MMSDEPTTADAAIRPEQIPTAPSPAPVTNAERIRSLDVLRGVAVLGILLVNVWAYALVFPASVNPGYAAFNTALDRAVVFVVWLVAYTKFYPVFSMLFGAGIVLFTERVEARGLPAKNLFYRRQLWLLLIALVHAYLIWTGDILVPYAVCGMIVYLFRRRRPRTQVLLGLILTVVPIILMQIGAGFMAQAQADGLAAEAALEAGEDLDGDQRKALEVWRQQRQGWDPTLEDIEKRNAVMRSGYSEILSHTVLELITLHVAAYPAVVGWFIAGLMLFGMALYKTGVMSGERDTSFYLRMCAIGYGLGLPLVVFAFAYSSAHHGVVGAQMRVAFPLIQVSGTLVALGHVALVVLATRKGWFGRLEHRLAATGRMAFTNYISQTLICVTVFYGYGFGLFGTMNRVELFAVAVAVWILQLWWSPLWLRHFRFGPVEWLWRSLTYRRLQPLKLAQNAAPR